MLSFINDSLKFSIKMLNMNKELLNLKIDNKKADLSMLDNKLDRAKQKFHLNLSDIKEIRKSFNNLKTTVTKLISDIKFYGDLIERTKSNINYRKKQIPELENQLHIFPIKKNRFTLLGVKCISVRIWYDSDWDVFLLNEENVLEKIRIVRRCGESFNSLVDEVLKCEICKDILNLDVHDQIYYD